MDTSQFDATTQTHAEAEALRSLWVRTIPGCTPTMDAISAWLSIAGYVTVARVIYATERLNQKYRGQLKPSQLIQFVKQQLGKEESGGAVHNAPFLTPRKSWNLQ
jgi:hypothetical protein